MDHTGVGSIPHSQETRCGIKVSGLVVGFSTIKVKSVKKYFYIALNYHKLSNFNP